MTEFGIPVTEGPVPGKIPTAILFANGGKYAPYLEPRFSGKTDMLSDTFYSAILVTFFRLDWIMVLAASVGVLSLQ
jgi:hypothetical protein